MGIGIETPGKAGNPKEGALLAGAGAVLVAGALLVVTGAVLVVAGVVLVVTMGWGSGAPNAPNTREEEAVFGASLPAPETAVVPKLNDGKAGIGFDSVAAEGLVSETAGAGAGAVGTAAGGAGAGAGRGGAAGAGADSENPPVKSNAGTGGKVFASGAGAAATGFTAGDVVAVVAATGAGAGVNAGKLAIPNARGAEVVVVTVDVGTPLVAVTAANAGAGEVNGIEKIGRDAPAAGRAEGTVAVVAGDFVRGSGGGGRSATRFSCTLCGTQQERNTMHESRQKEERGSPD